MIITRRTHPLIKELRELRDHPSNDLLFLEGPRLIEEALKAAIAFKTLVVSTAVKEDSTLLGRAKARADSTFSVADAIFKSISDVEEPQGILAIGQRPRWSWETLLNQAPQPIVILDGLQNPGNAAAVLRSAEAAGAAGVITTPGTAHLFSPKALRGSAGSALRLPSLEHQKPETIMETLKKAGYTLYAADSGEPGRTYTELDWTQPTAVILGQEGRGLSNDWHAEMVSIPMRPPVESLNVATAAAILLYEAARQRLKR